MANAKTKSVTFRSILNAAAFRKGYEEARKGLPLDPDAYPFGREVWLYERGRQFAFCYEGRLKEGNRIRLDALYAFAQAYHAGHII